MEQGKGDGAARVGGNFRLASKLFPTENSLIAGIRRGDERAIRDLFILYAPLLRDQARKMRVPAGECAPLVETLLGDVAIHLSEVDVVPRGLAQYLVTALRNRARHRQRGEHRQYATDEAAYGEYGDSSERIVAECHSEYGMRAAQPIDESWGAPLRAAVAKLAHRSASELTRDEVTMMVGIGRHIPLRELAEQLGLTYGAARVRLSRLRARFLKLAIQYMRTLEPGERAELVRFFRRADIRLTDDSGEAARDRGRRKATPNSSREKS